MRCLLTGGAIKAHDVCARLAQAGFADAQVYDCTMDHIHPNDTGFMKMGETIAVVIRHALERLQE